MRLQLSHSESFCEEKFERSTLVAHLHCNFTSVQLQLAAGSRGMIEDYLKVRHRTQFPCQIWWYENLVPAASSSSWSSRLKTQQQFILRKVYLCNPSNLQTFLLLHHIIVSTCKQSEEHHPVQITARGYSPCHHGVVQRCQKTLFEEETESKHNCWKNRKRRSLVINPWSWW